MSDGADLYVSTYGRFTDPVSAAIRAETFGDDIGQNSWITVAEYERFLDGLGLAPAHQVLEVACGSGGPALHLARRCGCRVTGIDANPQGVGTAARMAAGAPGGPGARFAVADATRALPFRHGAFDALVCIDAMNHFPDRLAVLREWRRVLRGGGRAVFTDPVVITGPVTDAELALRSSIGGFLFVPPGINERLIEQAGLRLREQEDVTGSAAEIAGRWHRARQAHREALLDAEGGERFAALQRFFACVQALAGERRLSRFVYLVERPAD